MLKMQENIIELMRKERTAGKTISELTKKFECSRGTVHLYVKDCPYLKIKVPRKKRIPETFPVKRPNISKGDLGEAARQSIIAKLMLNEISVFRPLSECTPIDLLVLKKDGSVVKCQCKYIYPTKKGSHELRNSSNGRKESRNKHRHIYTKEDIDFLIGFCLDNEGVYIIPIEDIKNRYVLTLWINREPISRCLKKHFNGNLYKNKFDFLK